MVELVELLPLEGNLPCRVMREVSNFPATIFQWRLFILTKLFLVPKYKLDFTKPSEILSTVTHCLHESKKMNVSAINGEDIKLPQIQQKINIAVLFP